MRNAGRSRRYVVLLWIGATLISAAAAVLGFALFSGGGVERGWLEAFAAGAHIALVVETMAPEAVHGQPGFTGLLAMLGFSALLLTPAKCDLLPSTQIGRAPSRERVGR